MADNRLELVVTVEVDNANQSIKSVNASLSSMEASATRSANGAAQGIVGLFVDFQKKTQIAELQLDRALTETGGKQIRYNAVMCVGAKIQGAHWAASQTAEGQLGALRREFNHLREDIGAKFQYDLKALVSNLRGLAGWLKENTEPT